MEGFPKDINHFGREETISGTVFTFLKCPALSYILKKNVLTGPKDSIKFIQPSSIQITFPNYKLCVEFQKLSDGVGKDTRKVESMCILKIKMIILTR